VDPLSTIMAALAKAGVPPAEAIALRGYLATSEDPLLRALRAEQEKVLAGVPTNAEKEKAETILAALKELGSPDDAARIYLSARFDLYVDFNWSDDLIVAWPPGGGDPDREDFSTTVWLRPRPDKPYVVVTRTPLEPDQRFVRGQLLEDFMAKPEAQTVWDEQTYSPTAGKKSNFYCTA